MTRIRLVRHGQSVANANGYDNRNIADSRIELTDLGKQQAEEVGTQLGWRYLHDALTFCSPYVRTRQTLQHIYQGAKYYPYVHDKRIFEDPRLREVEHGYEAFEPQVDLQEIHGKFFYRLNGGESPADCYDRVSTFLESLKRRVNEADTDEILIISHGLTIRVFVMRFLHLTVEQYNAMQNPKNCAVVTIAPKDSLANPVFTTSKWGVEGIELR